jgi:hypothetical protein
LVLVAQGQTQTIQMVVMVVILYLAVLHQLAAVAVLMALEAPQVAVLEVAVLVVELLLVVREHLVRVMLEARAAQEMGLLILAAAVVALAQ